jgi:hypothetical protein
VNVNTNIAGWFRAASFAAAALYLWRSAFFPKGAEPRGKVDRGLRIFGAILLSAVVMYSIGIGLGLYGWP